jgi:preprotein translocase subunit SecG
MTLFITLLYILFVLAAIVLIVVILLQEGKGGGLTDALGTSGQATFGVGSSGINRFTGITAGVFLVAALLIHILSRRVGEESVAGESFGKTEQIVPPPGSNPPGGQVPPAPTGNNAPPPSGGNAPAPSGGNPPGGSTPPPK